MKYETVLLIGGQRDGVRMSVMEGVPSIRLAVLPDTAACIRTRSGDEAVNYETVEYRRVTMSGDQGFMGCVYVFDGVEPMSALINGYRQPTDGAKPVK